MIFSRVENFHCFSYRLIFFYPAMVLTGADLTVPLIQGYLEPVLGQLKRPTQ